MLFDGDSCSSTGNSSNCTDFPYPPLFIAYSFTDMIRLADIVLPSGSTHILPIYEKSMQF